MSAIRRQSIIATLVVYTGFAIGLLNTYFFTKEGAFTTEEYGLTTLFIQIALLMTAFANLAMPNYIFKFAPYYQAHLKPSKSDMMSWALLIGITGCLLVLVAGIVFKDLVIRKYEKNSILLVQYYYWVFPLGIGLTLFNILEAYTWSLKKPIITNFLREIQWRLLTTIIIALYITQIIGEFSLFIKLYAFTYPGIALILLLYLICTKQIHFTFQLSKVTRKLFKKIGTFSFFVYSSTLVFTISQVFDSLVIGSVLENGMEKVAIFGLAQLMTSIIQAPQRAIVSAAIPHLSQAWKDKNQALIQKIYQRSSINLLLFSLAIFSLIVLNYQEAIITFKLKDDYLLGFHAFIFLGLTRVIDLGSGVNGEIISTSNYWRFLLLSGVTLLLVMLPLTYIFALKFDILGPAIANFVSIIIYNFIRIGFLWKKFRLFPFTRATLLAIFIAIGCYIVSYYAFNSISSWLGLIGRTSSFILLYATGILVFKLSPDIIPVLQSIKNRFRST